MMTVSFINSAYQVLKNVVRRTPLEHNQEWSDKLGFDLWMKREDQQLTRSYKIRGAYYFISEVAAKNPDVKVVCASAGNHAQGLAWSCSKLRVHGTIFMPKTTPKQKLNRTAQLGGDWVKIILFGDSFDDAYSAALEYEKSTQAQFIHPFNHEKIISGQGTVGLEILEQFESATGKLPDVILVPIGGGGLSSGIITWCKEHSPQTIIIGVEPLGAAAMKLSLENGAISSLSSMDTFVDGAAVKTPGSINFEIIKNGIEKVITTAEGQICTTILEIYNDAAIVLEPAGALTLSALRDIKLELKGKSVVCILSGGNNDINRMAEIQERSLLYEGLKHYFIIRFAQRPGALRDFLDKILGPHDDITRFEYVKKTKREGAPALVGVEVHEAKDFIALQQRMDEAGVDYTLINEYPTLFELLV